MRSINTFFIITLILLSIVSYAQSNSNKKLSNLASALTTLLEEDPGAYITVLRQLEDKAYDSQTRAVIDSVYKVHQSTPLLSPADSAAIREGISELEYQYRVAISTPAEFWSALRFRADKDWPALLDNIAFSLQRVLDHKLNSPGERDLYNTPWLESNLSVMGSTSRPTTHTRPPLMLSDSAFIPSAYTDFDNRITFELKSGQYALDAIVIPSKQEIPALQRKSLLWLDNPGALSVVAEVISAQEFDWVKLMKAYLEHPDALGFPFTGTLLLYNNDWTLRSGQLYQEGLRQTNFELAVERLPMPERLTYPTGIREAAVFLLTKDADGRVIQEQRLYDIRFQKRYILHYPFQRTALNVEQYYD